MSSSSSSSSSRNGFIPAYENVATAQVVEGMTITVSEDKVAELWAKEKAKIERARLDNEIAEKKRVNDALIQHSRFVAEEEVALRQKEEKQRLDFIAKSEKLNLENAERAARLIRERDDADWADRYPDLALARQRERDAKARLAQLENDNETKRAIEAANALTQRKIDEANANARREIELEGTYRREKKDNVLMVATFMVAAGAGLGYYASCL